MSFEAIVTCVVLIVSIILMVWQPVPIIVIGALIPTVLAMFGIIDAGKAFTEFGNSNVVLLVAMCVIGEAFFKTGLAEYIATKVVNLVGKTNNRLLVGAGIVTGGMSGFLNDGGTTACMIPIVSSIAEKAHVSKSALLMGIAYFASLGGTITLIGTPPHVVVNGILEQNGLREFGFFEYAKIGIPLLIMGVLYMIFIGSRLLPSKDINIKNDGRTMERNPVKMVITAVIYGFAILMMATGTLSLHIAATLGAVALILTGCLTIEDAVKSFAVQTIFLIGGIFPLCNAMVSSGAAGYLVNIVSPILNGVSGFGLLLSIAFLQLLATQFLMNSAATTIVTPIALMLCQAGGVNPLAGAMVVSICASGAFATPFGTTPNVLVWEAGGYTVKDYIKCGLPLTILFGLLTATLCMIFYV